MALKPLYILPLMLVLVKQALHGDLSAITVGVGVITFAASSLTGGLAGIAISGEDIPDLLASAPVPSDTARRAKLLAGFLPVAVLCSPVLAVLCVRPLVGIACIFGILAGGVSEGLIQLWYVKPTARRKFGMRATGSFVGNLGGMVSDIGWAITAGLLADGSVWSILAASLPISILFFLALNASRADGSLFWIS
jgi:ABC-2 type transport system permease protein